MICMFTSEYAIVDHFAMQGFHLILKYSLTENSGNKTIDLITMLILC